MPARNQRRPDPATVPQGRSVRASLTGDNGRSAHELDRLARIEHLLEQLQQSLDVQFERIAQLQAQLDRAISDRPIQPKS